MSYDKMTNDFVHEEYSLDVSARIKLLEKAISNEKYIVSSLRGNIKYIESEFRVVMVLWIILILLTIDFFTNFLDIIIIKILTGNIYLKIAYIIGYVYLWGYTVRKTMKNIPEYISCQNARKNRNNRIQNPVDDLAKHEMRLEGLNRELENIKEEY